MNIIARILFETSPWSPTLTALAVGYAVIGWDGQIYLSAAGQEYLDGVTV
jgi:hypothetical protein